MRLLSALCFFGGTAYSSATADDRREGLWSSLEGACPPWHLTWTQTPPSFEDFEAFRDRHIKERRLWNACHTAYMALSQSYPPLDAQRDLFETLWEMGRVLRDAPPSNQDVVDAFYTQVRGFCGAQGMTDEAAVRSLQDTRTRVKETKKYAYLRAFMGERLGIDINAWTVDLTRSPEIVALDEAFLTYVDGYTPSGTQYPRRTAFAAYWKASVPLHGKQLTKPLRDALGACAQTLGVSVEAFDADFSRYFSRQKEILKSANWAYTIQFFIRKQPFFFDFDLLEETYASFWDGNGAWQKSVPVNTYEDIFQSLARKNVTALQYDPRFAVRGGFVLSEQVDLKEEPITDEEKAKIREVIMVDGHMADRGAGSLPDGLYAWAMNPDAVLRVVPLNAMHHSGLFQKNQIGLPLACAGELEVRSGLIRRLDNETGHYLCTTVQLALAVKILQSRGMLDKDCGVDVRAFGGVPVRRSVDDMVRLTDCVRLP